MRAWMQRFLLALTLLWVPALAEAEPVAPVHPVLASGDMRTNLDLSGLWHYSIDPYRDGMAGFHGGDPGLGHRRYDTTDVAAAMRDDPAALYEYDMTRSPTSTLPASWMTHDATMRHYRGLVWYQRDFTADPKPGERQFLRFGAVNYRARIYLNGKSVGAHEGGFTTFAFEVTGLLKPGANQITIGVDSERSDTDLPPPVTDWETYGGITRAVTLVTTPATYVDDAWVRLTRDRRIAVDAVLDGKGAAGGALTLAIPALGLTLDGKADAAGHWSVSVPVPARSEEHTSELPSLMRISYAVFCLNKKNNNHKT